MQRGKSIPEVILKRFQHPDDLRTFEKGKFEVVRRAADFFRKNYEVIEIDGVRVNFAAGWGLLQRETWARTLALILAFISLFTNIPLGTAMGVYTMWVLLPSSSEQEYHALVAASAVPARAT